MEMIVCCRENRYRLVENINYIYDQVFLESIAYKNLLQESSKVFI